MNIYAHISYTNHGKCIGSGYNDILKRYQDDDKMKLFFEYFSQLPFWYQTIFVGVIASVYGLKATDLIKRK